MNYLEVSITVPYEAAEATAWALTERGLPGLVINERRPEDPSTATTTMKAYFPELEDPIDLGSVRETIEEILRDFPGATYDLATRSIPEENWATSWQQYWHVQHVGEHVVIRPSWEPYEPAEADVVITLDPKQAFGTGTHQTTRLCLVAIERIMKREKIESVFDVGAGTGILAIAAAKMGARRAIAVDNDPVAVASAQENTEINEVTDLIDNRLGSASDLPGQAQLVVANILAEVIIELADELASKTAPEGYIVASGIITRKGDDVASALDRAGFEMLERNTEGDWVCLVGKRRK